MMASHLGYLAYPAVGRVSESRTAIVISIGILLLNQDRQGEDEGSTNLDFAGRCMWMAPMEKIPKVFQPHTSISIPIYCCIDSKRMLCCLHETATVQSSLKIRFASP